MDKISVIIPVYKVEPYLCQCLDSVVNQTYKNLEIIIIDDGSPDRCGAICDEYAVKDARIKLVHQQNKGLSAARNVGLSMATGKWISFVDSDDWCEPDMYEKVIASSVENDADITIYMAYRNSEDGQYLMKKYPNDFITEDPAVIRQLQMSCLSNKCAPFSSFCTEGLPWDKLFKASLIRDNGLRFPENLKAEEDRVFGVNAFQHAKKVSFLNVPLYHYRYNPTGIGTKYTPNRVEIDEDIWNELQMIGKTYHMDEAYYDICRAFYTHSIFLLGQRTFFHPSGGRKIKSLLLAARTMRKEPIATTLKLVDFRYLNKLDKAFVMCRWCPAISLYILTKIKLWREKRRFLKK